MPSTGFCDSGRHLESSSGQSASRFHPHQPSFHGAEHRTLWGRYLLGCLATECRIDSIRSVCCDVNRRKMEFDGDRFATS